MKVSIITPCYNSESTILDTLESVSFQKYKNIEHIIIDGESTDSSIKIIENYNSKKIKKIFIIKSKLYQAINIGIKKATGSIIGVLNSDDVYNNSEIIDNIVDEFQKSRKKIVFGNVLYFSKNNFFSIYRDYKINNFNKKDFSYGIMPPHPGTFLKKELYIKYGLYNENYKIASDFDLLLRMIKLNHIKYNYFDKNIVRMRLGGISTNSVFTPFYISKEIKKILEINNVKNSFLKILFRLIIKLPQIILFNNYKFNYDFELPKETIIRRKINYRVIKIVNNVKKIDFTKKFVLSGINLAFLAYLYKKKIKLYDGLIGWPDGIFSKKIDPSLKKIPGRDLIKNLILPKFIKRIHVIGNMTNKNFNFLKKKFANRIIENTKLPYGSMTKILLATKKIKIKINELYLITLPTPKQELIAEQLIKSKNKYNIICIGGGLNIASGDEVAIPKNLEKLGLEFMWRLRVDTIRRIFRLIETLIYYYFNFFKKNNRQVVVKY